MELLNVQFVSFMMKFLAVSIITGINSMNQQFVMKKIILMKKQKKMMFLFQQVLMKMARFI